MLPGWLPSGVDLPLGPRQDAADGPAEPDVAGMAGLPGPGVGGEFGQGGAQLGDRVDHSSETRCGPRSHKAPEFCRHGVLNGLAGLREDPSQVAAPAIHPPRAVTSASHARTSGWNRCVKKTTDATPASSTASTSASASAWASATGFSSSRCLPAA